MRVPLWVTKLAADFWREARQLEPFPRNLCAIIPWAVPLSPKFLPQLTTRSVDEWLRPRGIVCNFGRPERPLCACLVCRDGYGLALIEATDPEEEQRFSLAHELAHFLRDYWEPRQRACKRLGAAALEVLDGRRPPTADERLHSLLGHAPIGYHVHLMERTPDGRPASAVIAAAEDDANRLAYELLAPAEHVLAVLASRAMTRQRAVVANLLVQTYGLPEQQALHYASLLTASPRCEDPLLRHLKTLA